MNRRMIESFWGFEDSVQRLGRLWGILDACVILLTSETPLTRSALISSSFLSGQAMGEAEARAVRYIKKVVRRGTYIPKKLAWQSGTPRKAG